MFRLFGMLGHIPSRRSLSLGEFLNNMDPFRGIASIRNLTRAHNLNTRQVEAEPAQHPGQWLWNAKVRDLTWLYQCPGGWGYQVDVSETAKSLTGLALPLYMTDDLQLWGGVRSVGQASLNCAGFNYCYPISWRF